MTKKRERNLSFATTLKQLLLIVVATLSLSSCGSSIVDKVKVEGYDNLKLSGLTAVDIDIQISNSSRRQIELSDVELTINRKGKRIGTLALSEPLIIPKRSESEFYPTHWRIRNINPLTALSASKELLSREPSNDFTVDAKGTIKAGRLRFKIVESDIEIQKLQKLLDK